MQELTFEIDAWSHDELKGYLSSLKGVIEVFITNEVFLKISIKYLPDLITAKILKMEILLFLNILKMPSIIAFNKHCKENLSEYEIAIKDLCCEYCLKSMIEDLFLMTGIESVSTEFVSDDERCVKIKILYNKSILKESDLSQLEIKLNSE